MSNDFEQEIIAAREKVGRQYNERFIRWRDISVRTLNKKGSSTKPTLVFLHGWGASAETWFPVLSEMDSEHFSSILIDLPGFGKSGTPKEALGVDDVVALVAHVCEEYDREHVVVVGHSFGGQVATKLAHDYPQLVDRLVLANASAVRTERKTITAQLASLTKPLFDLPGLRRFKKQILSRLSGTDYQVNPAMYPTLKRVTREDMTPILADITQPTLIIWGEEDMVTPPEEAYTISDHIDQALLVMLPEARHYTLLEEPAAFADNLISFIKHSE